MARTRPSPICCATSAVTVIVVALELDVHLEREVDLRQRVGRELDVDDRADDRDDPSVLEPCRSVGSAVASWQLCSRWCRAVCVVSSSALAEVDRSCVGLALARNASAPPTISMISVVIESWRARFIDRG